MMGRALSDDHKTNPGMVDFELLPTPISGQADWREFRCIKLANGCTVCLGELPYGVFSSVSP